MSESSGAVGGVRERSKWIQRFHPSPDAANRLVCFPYAGGSASYFHGVSAALSPALDVLAVQYPGRQDHRAVPPLRSVEELADRAAEELLPWCDRPVTLFGHSMGAMVAYEVARRLTDKGAAPLSVVVSGRRAPTTVRREDVHLRDDDGIVAEMERLGGSDLRMFHDPELRALFLPVIRADYEAVETYRHRPGPPLPCPVLALLGDGDPMATVEETEAWAGLTSAAFALRTFPGGHFYLNSRAPEVIGVIREYVASLTG
ncbi:MULTISPECIES: thioesterase II family protein [Streptomyces]|uniref:thioesterase II family protein n=1 Tax=Streptomyces TaxID=1883 RepID=UPI00163C934B|nr:MULTISPECIES: alpha/beta fold hydrolase [Streptomyces]MBC2879678.1 thioesterase [Streptomyces sp. TYQ1024]UBI35074.1 alpha/beta fold hydrolase [Streptomyces mobaraensis]UKW27667.1 alpha/beta fold hydrolase [Streptomyces sp. TYQ1024]